MAVLHKLFNYSAFRGYSHQYCFLLLYCSFHRSVCIYSPISHQASFTPPLIAPNSSLLVYPLPTNVCLSVCHSKAMSLSQPLWALLPLKHSVFAQSFGIRIRGWIVNYSRSARAPCSPLSPLCSPSTCCWLISMETSSMAILYHRHFLFSSFLLLRVVQSKGSLGGSHVQEVMTVRPTEWC